MKLVLNRYVFENNTSTVSSKNISLRSVLFTLTQVVKVHFSEKYKTESLTTFKEIIYLRHSFLTLTQVVKIKHRNINTNGTINKTR